ncbi:DUF2304 domain-containing protein [Pedococcus sp. NPDC057267]|uniref:DUF2304 domain-containing protein n=1 Tax=Pedococcus sp. NPDC057267 TaxID=3346077 RepID=UPI00362A27BF
MKALTIQVVLIVVTVATVGRVVSGAGARTQAVRRLGLLVFGAFAIWSILSPEVWTSLAHLVGIGRGTDLILYGLVIAFFSFVVTSFRRFREAETRYTKLARRIAIDEAPPASTPLADAPPPQEGTDA